MRLLPPSLNPLPHIATVATAVVMAVTVTPSALALSAREVAKVAVPTTVRIDNLISPENGGSGVIIAKDKKTYTVLTAAHVVRSANTEYAIYTSKKTTYPVTHTQVLPKTPDGPDLAIVTFNSDQEQAVAPLANSDEVDIGSGVYISGYPQSAEDKSIREYEFTAGHITSRPDNRPNGYTIRYDAVTRRGMSGGPVFDVSGRVVGIHGQGDRDAVVANEAGAPGSTTEVKTGFNAAVPINYFFQLASEAGINTSAVKVDKAEVSDDTAVTPKHEEVKSWENEFGSQVGLMILQQIIPIPFRLF